MYYPQEWLDLNLDGEELPRFDESGRRIIPDFPGINGWPASDSEAKAKFMQLDEGGYGCPFSWLLESLSA